MTGGLHSIRNFYRESYNLPATLQTQYIGRKITWVRSLPSTQGFAKHLVSAYGVSRVGGYVVKKVAQDDMEISGFHLKGEYGYPLFSVRHCILVDASYFPFVLL